MFQTGGVIEAAGVTFASNTALSNNGGAVFQSGGSFKGTNANFTGNTAFVRAHAAGMGARALPVD